MSNSTFIKTLTSWLCLLLITGTQLPQAWAQTRSKGVATQQLDPGDGSGGTNNGTVSLRGPDQVCVNTDTDFTGLSSCGGFYWEAPGATGVRQTTAINYSTITLRWATPGTYTVTVYASCDNAPTASRTVTVGNPTPGPITTTGEASQVTTISATICRGSSLQLVPPAGSTNWTWNGAMIKTVTSSGVATVQPVADANTYSVSYTPSGSACTITSTFVVNVSSPPDKPVVVGTDAKNTVWRFGTGDFTLVVQNPNSAYAYTWYDDATSTTALRNGPTYQLTNATTPLRTYYVAATSCQSVRTAVSLLLRKIRILVGGAVPTAAVRLTPGVPLTLQANTISTNSGPITWFLNGILISNQSASTLVVTQPGRYTARLNYPADPYSLDIESQPVDVVTGLAAQTINGQNVTYLSDTQVLQAGVTSAEQIPPLATADKLQKVTYLTGWAQPVQQVAMQAGPAQEDLVQHYTYAGNPTTTQSYLPVPISGQVKVTGLYEADPVAKVNAYYAALDNQPYGSTTTEASPLGRPVNQAQTGSAWASHPDRVSYETNTAQDGVRRWQGLTSSAAYGAGQLMKEVLLDADNRRTEVYKDPAGRVVLQRKITGFGGSSPQNFDTYSVYADAGYLQYVIPPAAVGAMTAANTWAVSSMPAGFASQWLYQYTYDDFGRLVQRQFPGVAPVYLVYDKFDRPILVQDGTHRAAKQWLFTKFDAQNRPVVSGLYYYDNQTPTARQDLQNLADATTLTGDYESRTSTGYTTSNTFPAVQDGANGAVVLSKTFFDDYDLNQDGTADYAYTSQPLGTDPQPVAIAQVRGLQTVTQTRVVQPGNQYGPWLTAALFYDEYGNLIQKQSNNLLQTGSSLGDITTLVYRQQGFVPQVLRSLKTQQTAALAGNTSPTMSVRNRLSYDAAGRLLKTWQQHMWKNNWEPEVLVSSNTYTGLGELTIKQLHSRDGVSFLQKEDFAYNLHGQLARINQSMTTASSAFNYADKENDLFGLLIYREQVGSMGGTPRYDGGIAGVSWMAHNAAQVNQPELERSYRFSYDDLGRMTDALYAAKVRKIPSGFGFITESWTGEVGAYDEKSIKYDANGNITGLQRYSQASSSASPVLLDNLTFTYAGTGNQHSKVADGGDATRGFKDANPGGVEYDYDANGSITRDANKNVTYVFNALNKVEKQAVGVGSLNYTYDAAGTLLKREVTANGAVTKTEYYLDGVVYQAAPSFTGLLSVPTVEGRAMVPNAQATSLTYEYHLRDHLGNLRVAFRAQAGTEDLHLSSESSSEQGAYPKFQNVTTTQSQVSGAYHGSYVAAVTRFSAGPSITIPVSHLDRLKVRVYYKTPAGVQMNRQAEPSPTMAKAAMVGFSLAPTLVHTTPPVEGRPSRATPGIQVSFTGLLSRLAASRQPTNQLVQTQQTPTPLADPLPAYLKWTLINSKGETIKSGSGTKIAEVTANSSSTWTKLDVALNIDLNTEDARTGTLLLEEVNTASQAVYFDSLTITHPQDRALVTQENHYYPLGMAMSGVAVNTVPVADLSKEQFNEGSALQDELLGTEGGVYSTFYRTYDPATGRFTGVDPLADATPDWTTYQFALGNPIEANDPSGALASYTGGWSDLLRAIADGKVDEGFYVNDSGGGGGGGFTSFTLQSEIFNINGKIGYYTLGSSSNYNPTLNADGKSINLGSISVGADFVNLGLSAGNSLAFQAAKSSVGELVGSNGAGLSGLGLEKAGGALLDVVSARSAYMPNVIKPGILGMGASMARMSRMGSTILKLSVPGLKTGLNVTTSGRVLSVAGGVLKGAATGLGWAALGIAVVRVLNQDPTYTNTEATLDIVFGIASLIPPTAILGTAYTIGKAAYQGAGGEFKAF